MLKINSIYNEDCMNGVKKIPTASVDLVIIDPPYQLNFSKRKNKDRPQAAYGFSGNWKSQWVYDSREYLPWRRRLTVLHLYSS